ncbi:hypothetical protein BDA96_03G115200 [Sorghum bicolor]|uniref:SnoaL-like domain-containing protein n=2 Tax=Sorghum bicolor TaxID=4558 RepID=A0A1B6Q2L0_SORBI|nr:uncharacterized protein LOC110433890 [Sorghum bicolor]KAG0537058.1 hypothetical protein BDA96_03G115200 [Sorghum bicolor]KXG32164.1 hypothetical protein SORBI_3003G110700 [Sorghum bicolor]KXG32166.1 hypothetical protein SORBI_3003G110700 [Sorghum bicolor]|eukprot:XP_021312572.1 uncharacterized protein LOC110433890 [Sorghum bicolor]
MPLQHGPRLRMAAASGAARRPRSRLPGRPTSLPCGGSRTRTTALVLVAATTREGAKTTAAVATATAADVVRAFYDGVNRRDLAAVEPLIAEGCVYEDLVFPRPFVGRERIIGFFGEFMGTISPDLQFVIDDISADDSAAVGVTWHLEWRGKPFPFSRGCSFYRLLAGSESESEQQPLQIVYGRDCVEPAAKPGDLALVIIRGVTWILERFPSLASRF